MQEEAPPLFYRGELDDQKTTAENGAILNRDYERFIKDGPWGQVKTWPVGERTHTITGYGLPNYTFVEGATGLILIDTGMNIGTGIELLNKKTEFSDKPIVAIIYTHSHYTGGSKGILEQHPGIPIYGHPLLEKNRLRNFTLLRNHRRGAMQLGFYLPRKGADAAYGIDEPFFEDPALNGNGHIAVTHPVGNGEKVTIDSLQVVFHHTVSDTDDSLVIHFPELDLVVHNAAVMPMLFPLYTLRGDFFRNPEEVIAGIDLIRGINPGFMIGCHGLPVSDKQQAYDLATAHRDAYAYLFHRTVQGINRGMTPDQLSAEIRLPKHLAEHPQLFPAYVDLEYIVRGIYSGLIGWWAEDSADLHPPDAAEFDAVLVEGFGGAEKVLQRAQKAFDDGQYNLAARLASTVLNVNPQNNTGKQLKADTLRRMAQATKTGIQTRNFLLTEALHLEGALDRTQPLSPAALSLPELDLVLDTPPGSFLTLLEYNIDTKVAANLDAVAKIKFTDLNQTFGLAVRNGIAELLQKSPQAWDLAIEMERTTWAEIVLRRRSLQQAVDANLVSIAGDEGIKEMLLDAYRGGL